MAFTFIIVLVGALLLLIVGINVIQQQKARAEANQRAEFARQRAIIDETEAVLANTGVLPCSTDISLVLYRRIQEALEASLHIAGNQQPANYQRRLADLKAQITALESGQSQLPSIESFRVPSNDKQVLALVQTLKKLKSILRAEQNKGKVSPNIFTQEEGRIDSLQLRINVESMLTRARAAINAEKFGSSKQLVSKALSTLNAIKAQSPNDPFVTTKLDEAKLLLDEIMKSVKDELAVEPKAKEGDDLDMLFQPKKKW